ncbi:hypothetical protein, partial [Asticcacaulis biprosthecium]|uniref:hypothetical protein n=1 Tax=Asticcacaulis biprosthecium TaxID=76891 RepID=UPI001B7FEC76
CEYQPHLTLRDVSVFLRVGIRRIFAAGVVNAPAAKFKSQDQKVFSKCLQLRSLDDMRHSLPGGKTLENFPKVEKNFGLLPLSGR